MCTHTHTNDPSACDEQLRNLKSTVNDIDAQSQDGCSEIAAIAKLTLTAMEVPDKSVCGHELIAQALKAIWHKAEDTQNYINCMAEDVGCNWTDEAFLRRLAAKKESRS